MGAEGMTGPVTVMQNEIRKLRAEIQAMMAEVNRLKAANGVPIDTPPKKVSILRENDDERYRIQVGLWRRLMGPAPSLNENQTWAVAFAVRRAALVVAWRTPGALRVAEEAEAYIEARLERSRQERWSTELNGVDVSAI